MVAGRSLRLLDCLMDEAVDEMVPEAGLVDPPNRSAWTISSRSTRPKNYRSVGPRRLIVFLAVLVAALLVLVAAWRWTPLWAWPWPQGR